jgi:hypothetical protein
MQLKDCVVFALLAALPAQAAQWASRWEADFDEEAKPWKEIQALLPPSPQPKNLVLMEGGRAGAHNFYVDTASISLGEDGVTRYTAVLKTSGGATNVTFEGIRCETREHKLYALGRADGTWVRARDPKWQRVVSHEKPYQWMLYREFFCPAPSRPTPPKQAIDALKRGVGLAQSPAMD